MRLRLRLRIFPIESDSNHLHLINLLSAFLCLIAVRFYNWVTRWSDWGLFSISPSICLGSDQSTDSVLESYSTVDDNNMGHRDPQSIGNYHILPLPPIPNQTRSTTGIWSWGLIDSSNHRHLLLLHPVIINISLCCANESPVHLIN